MVGLGTVYHYGMKRFCRDIKSVDMSPLDPAWSVVLGGRHALQDAERWVRSGHDAVRQRRVELH